MWDLRGADLVEVSYVCNSLINQTSMKCPTEPDALTKSNFMLSTGRIHNQHRVLSCTVVLQVSDFAGVGAHFCTKGQP